MTALSKDDIRNLIGTYGVSIHDSVLFLAKILNTDYSSVFFQSVIELTNSDFDKFVDMLKRRGEGEPVAKIIQEKEFYGLKFKTTASTLDPRPETEFIIDLFKEYCTNDSAAINILDLGSGTGCIGITLLSLYRHAKCTFIDISTEALEVARENSILHKVTDRSDFVLSNWFSNVHESKYDAIVSNPPYVSDEYELDKETLYDPELALFAGKNGMDAYHKILPEASKFLTNNGLLIIEIGFDQSQKIKQVSTDLSLIKVQKDFAGIDRICVFQKQASLEK